MKLFYSTLAFTIIAVMASNAQTNALFTTTTQGGSLGYGTILQGDMDGSNFHVVYNFDWDNGSSPLGRLVQTSDGKIYCCTQFGGFTDSCVICCYDPATGTCHKVYDYYYTPELGWAPVGGMVLYSDNLLYGLTNIGGAADYGSIYSFNVVDSIFTDVYDFDSANCNYPNGELLIAPDGKFYATGSDGGTHGFGGIFSFDPTNHDYNTLYNFNNSTDGAPTAGDLIYVNNKLFGLNSAYYTEATGTGVLYSLDLSTLQFSRLHIFAADHTEGIATGGLLLANDGKLYGMTRAADSVNYGGIYSYDLTTNSFTMLHLFDSTASHPVGTLMQFNGGKLFGNMFSGGDSGNGAIFNYDISTHIFTRLLSLDLTTGFTPEADIIEASIPTTGICRIPQSDLSLYPNPTSEQTTLTLSQTNAGSLLNIYDISGNKVAVRQLGNETQINLNVSQWAKGPYLVEITTDSKTYRSKLVVN